MGLARAIGNAFGTISGSFAAARARELGAVVDLSKEPNPNARASGVLTSYQQLLSMGKMGVQPQRGLHTDAERYLYHTDVFAATRLLARNAAKVPFIVKRDGERVTERDSAYDLELLLARCNPSRRGSQFWERVYSWQLLSGMVYLYIARNNPLAPRDPSQLWCLPPDFCRPVMDGTGVGSWRVCPPARPDRYFDATLEEVIRWDSFNPTDELLAAGAVTPNRIVLDQELSAHEANLNIFRNGMVDNIFVSPKEGEQFTDVIRDEIGSQMIEAAGAANAHQIQVLNRAMNITPIITSPADMQFGEMGKMATRKTASAFGVPEQFLGLLDFATLSNFETSLKVLWTMGIVLMIDELATVLTHGLGEPAGVTIEADYSGIEALREDSLREAQVATAWREAGATAAHAYKLATGHEPPEGALEPDSPAPTPSPRTDVPGFPKALVGPVWTKAYTPLQIVKRYRADRAQVAEEVAPGVAKALADHADATCERLARLMPQGKAWLRALRRKDAVTDGYVDLLIHGDGDGDPLLPALMQTLGAAAEAGSHAASELFGVAATYGRDNPAANAWLRSQSSELVKYINEDTRAHLRAGLAQGIGAGEPLVKLQARVKAAFALGGEGDGLDLYAGRAQAIAVTEVGSGYNWAANADIEAASLNREWLSALLPNTREDHAAAHGQVRAPGKAFLLGGERCQHPGDTSLSAGQRTRCKCAVAATEKAEAS